MILSDLEETLSRQLGEAEARALAYEQALRAAIRAAALAIFVIRKQGIMPNSSWQAGFEKDLATARAALDKPGTPAENSANEAEKQDYEDYKVQVVTDSRR